jgi:hypothetical protein
MPTVTVELTHEQLGHLRDIMQGALGDLRAEISGTERLAYRQRLREDEAVIRAVLDAIPPDGEEASAGR